MRVDDMDVDEFLEHLARARAVQDMLCGLVSRAISDVFGKEQE